MRRRGVERRQRGHVLGGGHPALEELRHPLLPVDAIAGATVQRSYTSYKSLVFRSLGSLISAKGPLSALPICLHFLSLLTLQVIFVANYEN